MEQHVQRMVSALSHRGPDGSGHRVDPEAGIALGHAHLAVLDLSDEGRQPMVSGCGTCTIIYNGEIYNFQELRQQLRQEGVFFHSQTDTEVVLEAIARWGIDIAQQKIDGMFAFAAWLRDERKLILTRDRIGKKPLYYGWSGGTFYFSSELRARRDWAESLLDERCISEQDLLEPRPVSRTECRSGTLSCSRRESNNSSIISCGRTYRSPLIANKGNFRALHDRR